MTILIAVATLIVLLCLGLVLDWRAQSRRRRQAAQIAAGIEQLVMLVQGVQKHRGLGAQKTQDAAWQSELLGAQLDRQWAGVLERLQAESAAGSELAQQLRGAWNHVRGVRQDFTAHCQLIDRLLALMSLQERQWLALQGRDQQVIAPRCRAIEDLGRLRGLSAHAANHTHCPIEFAVPLRYLCQRVAAGDLQKQDSAIRLALQEIENKLLQSARVELTSARCFELLTPSIDRALDALRQSFTEKSASRSAARAMRPAHLLPAPLVN